MEDIILLLTENNTKGQEEQFACLQNVTSCVQETICTRVKHLNVGFSVNLGSNGAAIFAPDQDIPYDETKDLACISSPMPLKEMGLPNTRLGLLH